MPKNAAGFAAPKIAAPARLMSRAIKITNPRGKKFNPFGPTGQVNKLKGNDNLRPKVSLNLRKGT